MRTVLHCPATVYVAPLPASPQEARRLAARLADRHLATVWSTADPTAAACAAAAAEHLGLPRRRLGPEEADDPHAALQAIADLHRGESVLAFGVGTPGVVEIGDDGWRRDPWPGSGDADLG